MKEFFAPNKTIVIKYYICVNLNIQATHYQTLNCCFYKSHTEDNLSIRWLSKSYKFACHVAFKLRPSLLLSMTNSKSNEN